MEIVLRILAGIVVLGLAIKGGWYGSTYGASNTALTFAMIALFAAVSLIKDTLAVVVPYQWERQNYPSAVIGTILLGCLTIWGVYTTTSVVSTSKYLTLDRANAEARKSKNVQDVIANLEKSLTTPHRKMDTIQSELIELEGKVVDKKSVSERVGDCSTPWKGWYERTYCPDIAKLKSELQVARNAEQDQKKLQELKLSGEGTVTVTTDPQAHVLSRIFGWSEEAIRLANIIVIAIVFEACSGLTLVASYRPSSPPKTEPRPQTIYKVRRVVVQPQQVVEAPPEPKAIAPPDPVEPPKSKPKKQKNSVKRLRGGVVNDPHRADGKRPHTIPRVVANAGKRV